MAAVTARASAAAKRVGESGGEGVLPVLDRAAAHFYAVALLFMNKPASVLPALCLSITLIGGCQAVLGIDILEDNSPPPSVDASQEAASDAAPEAEAEAAPQEETGPVGCDPKCPTLGLARPPCKPSVADAPSLPGPLVFAVSVMMGGLDQKNPDDWRIRGLDFDCLHTGAQGEPRSCAPDPKADSKLKAEDGDQGRDNSFGNIIGGRVRALAGALQRNIEEANNAGLKNGNRGLLFQVDDYNGLADDPKVTLTVFTSAGSVDGNGNWAKPGWAGNDTWSVESSSFVQGTSEALYRDSEAYVAGNVVVARLSAGIPILISGEVSDATWVLNQTTILVPMDAQHKFVTNGVIAGLWPRALAADAMARVLAGLGACPIESNYPLIDQALADSVDIRDNAGFEPDSACQAVSVGIGFGAVIAQKGLTVPPDTAADTPCKDGGAGDDAAVADVAAPDAKDWDATGDSTP